MIRTGEPVGKSHQKEHLNPRLTRYSLSICACFLLTLLAPLSSPSLASTIQNSARGSVDTPAKKGSAASPVPVIPLVYDESGNYCPRETWSAAFEKDKVDVFARALLAEENEKLFDARREEDMVGAGWVMENRTRSKGFLYYVEGEDALLDVILGGGQFALGGVTKNGKRLPGNAAIVADPEAYPAWFGDDPASYYRKAYEIAQDILGHKLPDPTHGALYFVDAYYETDNMIVPYPDGRTRFNIVYAPIGNYSIPELRRMTEAGQEFWVFASPNK